MIELFKSHLTNQCSIHKGCKILCAVSGGADSILMIHLLMEMGYKVGIGHVNFKLRNAASDADQALVEQFATAHKLAIHLTSFDTNAIAKDQKISIEMAARTLRYEWLETIRKDFQYDCIATGHHLNDSAETIILNLTKGTGVRGLHGIASRNNKVIRPLMCFTKEDIHQLLIKKDIINYATDSSNTDTKYQRNLIRHQVIPILESINPKLISTLADNSQRMKEVEYYYLAGIEAHKKKLLIPKKDEWFLAIEQLKNQPALQTILHEILSDFGFGNLQLLDIMKSIHTAELGQVFYSDTHRIIKDRKFLIISKWPGEATSVYYIKRDEGTMNINLFHLTWKTKMIAAYSPDHRPSIAFIDAEKLSLPLIIRPWKMGDYFYPLDNKKLNSDKPLRKKVSKYMKDQKMSPVQKEKTLIMQDNEGHIVWILNQMIDDRYKISTSTKQFLRFELKHSTIPEL